MATDTGTNRENDHDPAPSLAPVDEALVDQIWRDVQEKVPRTHISRLVLEARNDFAEATITTYVAIFVRREVRKKVASLIVMM